MFSAGTPLTPSGLRKMSLLSSISTTVQLGEDFDINTVSKDIQDHLVHGCFYYIIIEIIEISVFLSWHYLPHIPDDDNNPQLDKS